MVVLVWDSPLIVDNYCDFTVSRCSAGGSRYVEAVWLAFKACQSAQTVLSAKDCYLPHALCPREQTLFNKMQASIIHDVIVQHLIT